MKKLFIIALAALMVLSLVACKGKPEQKDNTTVNGTEVTTNETVEPGKSTQPDAPSNAGEIGPAVAPENFVIVDNEQYKVVVTGKGANPYNASWLGYTMELTNKTADTTIGFASHAKAMTAADWGQTLGGGDTCNVGGKLTDTHFENMIRPGVTYNKAVLAIDGITDLNQLHDVSGYIVVWDNDKSEFLGSYPYHFE